MIGILYSEKSFSSNKFLRPRYLDISKRPIANLGRLQTINTITIKEQIFTKEISLCLKEIYEDKKTKDSLLLEHFQMTSDITHLAALRDLSLVLWDMGIFLNVLMFRRMRTKTGAITVLVTG